VRAAVPRGVLPAVVTRRARGVHVIGRRGLEILDRLPRRIVGMLGACAVTRLAALFASRRPRVSRDVMLRLEEAFLHRFVTREAGVFADQFGRRA